MCEIVFDTQTTGFEPSEGHRPRGLLEAKVAFSKDDAIDA